jgi:D-inositol-3-phosphate glycosyltransferase
MANYSRASAKPILAAARRASWPNTKSDALVTQTSQLSERTALVAGRTDTAKTTGPAHAQAAPAVAISLLTGGGDRPYALGITAALTASRVAVDFIGSDSLDSPELRANPLLNFRNLRGDQRPNASAPQKLWRVLAYYGRLLKYAATARPTIFHILWNNKFEFFDRTMLMLYYLCLGKRIVFTAHNVNARQRDANDNWLNRFSLAVQYRLVDHIFVHTEMMKKQLLQDFNVPERKVTVIPFGINNTVPNTTLTAVEAKRRLGLAAQDRVLLLFGGITPYKGMEFAVEALAQLSRQDKTLRLLIAGKPKPDGAAYWKSIQEAIARRGLSGQAIVRSEYIPDEETELYFKAADVLLLPYTHIFQSGVLFLGYSFGLPVIASDVGSLKEEIIEGKTGFVVKPRDPGDLARTIEKYFAGDLYRELEQRRVAIRAFANDRYSWTKVAAMTTKVYDDLLAPDA